MYNKDRKSLKQLVRPEQYDNFVLDINTPLENTVQVIVQDDPDIILVPVNQSQRSKALRNLPRTLKMISQLEFKVGADPEVIIVPLGIEENQVHHVLESAENKPTRCRIAPGMPNLQEQMQVAVYEDRKYIWTYEGYEDLYTYFCSLLES